MKKFIIWVVDDRPENQAMITRSFRRVEDDVEIINILSCQEYFEMVKGCCDSTMPHIIFMDYFMRGHYGTELVKHFLDAKGSLPRPVIIGHSSNVHASEEIVKAGGDFVIKKVKGCDVSDEILDYFATIEDIEFIVNHRALPREPRMPGS